jgi:hypothetical protein
VDYEGYFDWIGGVDTPGAARGVAVIGKVACVVDGNLQVIDITDPENPRIIDRRDDAGRIAAAGVYLVRVASAAGTQAARVVILD